MPLQPVNNSFRIGSVEGFFGRQWSWQARRDHAAFLARQQFTTYLYAPKNDVYLRKQWFDPYPPQIFGELKTLAAHTAMLGIEFGVGLSPFELYRDFSTSKRDQLLRKLDQLNELQAPLLAILFDDMIGELPGLADTQLAIFECIRSASNASRFLLCPTYYSDDPLLVKHFGAQPARYLETLGQALLPEVGIFWTGPKVISQAYPRDHLCEVIARLGRKPVLWDNYPVNDARRLTPFLHLQSFAQRRDASGQQFSMAPVVELCDGLLANPMNQPYLSQIALHSLAGLYCKESGRTPASLEPTPTLQQLANDADCFQTRGLEQLSIAEKSTLMTRYRELLPDPMAAEVCEWLQGGYAFDPACLT